MIETRRFKVCGLTNPDDAAFAAKSGADYLGFIFHPASPRAMTLEKYRAFADRLPKASRVAVKVEPSSDDLRQLRAAGFDLFQVYFRHDISPDDIKRWADAVGTERLWLAPKLPPGIDAPEAIVPLAGTFLLDTFDPVKFGGTGRTGDWEKFGRHLRAHPEKTWILSGGLGPDNIAEAVHRTNAHIVDVNSGVESAPGVKDHAKLTAFVRALRNGD